MIPIGSIPMQVPDNRHYDRQLKKAHNNLQICKRLTNALYDYLTEAARSDIEDIEKLQSKPFGPTIEHLNQACQRRDSIQQQLDTMTEQVDNLERQIGGSKADGIVGVFRASLIMPLEMQLKDAEEWVSNIQQQMESAGAQSAPTE